MDVWISRGCPRRKFFINRNILKNISDVPLESPEMLCHAAFETLTISFHFFHLFLFTFFPSHLNRLYSQTWSGVSRDMSDDQRLPVCGWFILNEKTLWSGLRAASNAHHLQITMIKHSNGMDSYPQTSHSLRGLPRSNKSPVICLYFEPDARVQMNRLVWKLLSKPSESISVPVAQRVQHAVWFPITDKRSIKCILWMHRK